METFMQINPQLQVTVKQLLLKINVICPSATLCIGILEIEKCLATFVKLKFPVHNMLEILRKWPGLS
jgi:hypothetical protein